MKRPELREEGLKLKKNIKKWSVNQIYKFLSGLDKVSENRVIEAFRQELHEQLGIGSKRFARILHGVIKRMEGD